MKVFNESRRTPFDGLASSFSLAEKLNVLASQKYEAKRTSTVKPVSWLQVSNLTSAFLIACAKWLWKFVTCYSGATVLDFHEVPSHLTVLIKTDLTGP